MSTKNFSALFPLDHLTTTVDEAILCFGGMVSTMWCMITIRMSVQPQEEYSYHNKGARLSMTFGEFVRNLRAQKRLKLREFCLKNGHDPSNWSKMERGDLPPSQYRETLETWATQLGLEKRSDDWYKFFELAFLERGKINEWILFRFFP